MNSNLPVGWIETTVGEIAKDIGYGFTAKANSSPVGPRLLRITDIQNGSVQWDSVPYCEIPKSRAANYILSGGDILFARTGATTGKSFLIKSCPEAVFASYLIRVRPSLCVLPELLAQFFQSTSYWNQISENLSGSAQPNCNASKLATISLPLAPLAEQRRIVAKLEKLLGQVNACQQRLEKLPTLLKRFRQTILAAACSGRLTADWREKNPTSSNDAENDLPNGWQQTTVGDAIESLKYGASQKCSHEKQGVPVLRIPNIADGMVSQSNLKYAKLPEKEFQQLRLRVGDILLIRSNGSVSLVGKCALVRAADKDFAYAGYLIRLRPDAKKVSPEFLNLVLGSYGVRKQIEIPARSTSGVNNINSEEVRALEFMLPPLAEQQEIVRRVAGLFALADQLEQRLAQARKQVDKLTSSLLARAFAGKLVPQAPTDEPAEKLLESIHRGRDKYPEHTGRNER